MPKATVEDEPDFKLPKDVPLRAKFKACKVKTIKWNDRQTGEAKERDLWEWEFDLVDEEYRPLRAFGETDAKVSNRTDNKPRQWIEGMTGATLDLGDGVDTDDYLGMDCLVILDHVTRTKPNGDTFYGTPIREVYHSSMYSALTGEPDF